MLIPLLASIFVPLLNACFVLTIHCMIFGSLGIGKYLLKLRIGTRYLMELVSRNEARLIVLNHSA